MALETESPGTSPKTTTNLYLDLVRAFPLRPIRSSEEHDRAIAAIHGLADRYHNLTPEEKDYFVVLTMVVEHYEDEIYPQLAGEA